MSVIHKPFVTVLMTAYNSTRYIRAAIESILNQTFSDFEFLIIDDGSDDETCNVIQTYTDPRIRLIKNNQNIGLTRSLNRGLRSAEGHFIARQDSDDISEPERLARQINFLNEHLNVNLLGTFYQTIDEKGTTIGLERLPSECKDIRWSLLFFCPFLHSSVVFRKSIILDQIGFYNETYSYAQDHEYWLRIARRFPVSNLAEYLVRHRVHPQSLTFTIGEKRQEEVSIPANAVANLLGWEKEDSNKIIEHFKILYNFLYNPLDNLAPDTIEDLSQEVMKLQKKFCFSYDLDKGECYFHLIKLRAWISKQFSLRAYNCYDQRNLTESWRFFYQSMIWHKPRFFKLESLSFLLSLLRVSILHRQT